MGDICVRRRIERENSGGAEGLPDLLRGVCAGDLDTILLTVAMAAEENRLPCTNPEEEQRILAFLRRLAAFDTLLPQDPRQTR